ncbi:class I adenylate-forming enzyme family protein [Kordiimonas pumila]|uniref:Class I adenylate-forming enzyme family protein n=1 Tax=Kordiimonas pumila TaxID=2161677 RepID=A0ABV7D162_9PROT|nr:AMP-binding protein [Kordiimonas pumila]
MPHAKPLFVNPVEMLLAAADTHSTRIAFVEGDRQISYRDFVAGAIVISDIIHWQAEGAMKVAVALPNSALFVAAVFGGWFEGCKVSVHNVLQPPPALVSQMNMVMPDVILTTTDYVDKFSALESTIRLVILEQTVFQNNRKYQLGFNPAKIREATDTSLFLFTGGTTGKAKAVEHTFKSVMASVIGMEHAWPTNTGQETWLSISPMFHVYGFLFCALCPIYSRATNVMGYPFQTDSSIAAMKSHQVTVLSGGPPAVYAALLANEQFNRNAYKALRICGGGGAPFSEALLHMWLSITGVPITEAYGMTEMAPITSNGPDDGNVPGSVGKAGAGVKIEIRHHDTRSVLAAGEIGDVYVSGEQCMVAYYNNSAETNAVLSNGWLETGDVGYVNAEGYLFLTGRTKEMINVSGYKVYPREIDDLLLALPEIKEACTLGIPDERTGEAVVSCLTCETDISEEKVRAFCAERLAAYKIPKYIFVVDTIPKTPANKQDRLSLAKMLAAKKAFKNG